MTYLALRYVHLLGSGAWLIVTAFGGWAFLGMPWLAGMVGLFAFEFIEGNTVTRRYFLRLRRLTTTALAQGVASRWGPCGRTPGRSSRWERRWRSSPQQSSRA